jgi:hypothetical protein
MDRLQTPRSKPTKTQILKVFAYVLWSLSAACLLWSTYIEFDVAFRMPASPQPDTGRIYRIFVNHGYERYVTRAELERSEWLWNAAILGIAGFVSACALRKKYSQGRE